VRRLVLALLATLGAGGAAAEDTAPAWQAVTLAHTEQRSVHSRHTGRDYRIFVARPQQEPPAAGYPVLFVLDGNALFPTLALQAQALEARPDPALRDSVLVVGIGYPNTQLYDFEARAEDYTPDAADRQRFLAFIEDELKPLIAARYRVDPSRQTLFGHSYGGLFTLYALLERPQAFSGYVAASPSIWWYQGFVERRLSAFERRAGKAAPRAQLLITAGSAEEPQAGDPLSDPRQRHLAERRMVGNARETAQRLAAVAGLRVDLRINAGANHGTNAQYSTIQALELASRVGRAAAEAD